MPKPLSDPSFDPIPRNSVPVFLFHHKPQPVVRQTVGRQIDDEGAAREPTADSLYPQELRAFLQALLGPEGLSAAACGRHDRPMPRMAYTAKRFRPLARLRLMTARPDFVAMRTRNPCVRFLLRL